MKKKNKKKMNTDRKIIQNENIKRRIGTIKMSQTEILELKTRITSQKRSLEGFKSRLHQAK
jgi:hypothetical protein